MIHSVLFWKGWWYWFYQKYGKPKCCQYEQIIGWCFQKVEIFHALGCCQLLPVNIVNYHSKDDLPERKTVQETLISYGKNHNISSPFTTLSFPGGCQVTGGECFPTKTPKRSHVYNFHSVISLKKSKFNNFCSCSTLWGWDKNVCFLPPGLIKLGLTLLNFTVYLYIFSFKTAVKFSAEILMNWFWFCY